MNFLSFFFLFFSCLTFGQYSSSVVNYTSTFSENLKYKIKNYHYDNETPSVRGRSVVYDISSYREDSLYMINRAFDTDQNDRNYKLFLSNDGRKVIYFSGTNYYDNKGENKNIVVYVDGKIHQKFTSDEFTNCNQTIEKCGLFYYNYNNVVDRKKSTRNLIVYKDNISEKEKYLLEKNVFSKGDTIYLVDARKKVVLYDLNNLKLIKRNIEFDSIFPTIKTFGKFENTIIDKRINWAYKSIPELADEKKITIGEKLSSLFNLKFVPVSSNEFHKYHLYRVEITGYLNKNGIFELESIETDKKLDKNIIIDILNKTRFNTDFVPSEVEKIYMKNFFGGFRNFDDEMALKETENQKLEQQKRREIRLTLENIDGFYIPKNMQDCMVQLDKVLNFESKQKLKNSKENWEYNSHLGGLGMWIRNNWGLNGGSRLLIYFHKRNFGTGVWGNDSISGEIISNYVKWLNGEKEIAKKWEKAHPKLKE